MENSGIIGNPEDLFKSEVSTMIARRSLPEVVGFLVAKRGAKQAEQDLRDISRMITERMLMVWKPKHIKPFQIVKEMMKLFFGNKKIVNEEDIKNLKNVEYSLCQYLLFVFQSFNSKN